MSRLSCALSLAILLVGPANTAAAAGPQPRAVHSGTRSFSMDVWKRPLREVAMQLARQGSIDILIPAAIENLEVSASLVDTDARAALQRMLTHHSYMLIERDGEGSGEAVRRVIEIRLLGASAMSKSTPTAAAVRITANEDRSVDELVQSAVAAASGSERATAVDAIAYRDPMSGESASRARSVLLSALSDPAEEVRAQAIETLKDTADEIPFDALSQVAREDTQFAIRIQALELLVERGEEHALEPVRVALLDPEDAVRARARELLEEWHLDARAISRGPLALALRSAPIAKALS